MKSRTVSRRTFLQLASFAGAAVVLEACAAGAPQAPAGATSAPAAGATTAPAAGATAAPAAPAAASKEAPMLAELVQAGTLPPLEQRLPQTPLVVQPLESIGRYGGQWRTGTIERNGNDLIRNIGYEQLMRYTPDYGAVIPNVAESVEESEDGTTYTFKLREGLKWSDGSLFTADDIVFWYEDVVMNAELTPTAPSPKYTITKVDDLTVSWAYENPNGLFLKDISRTNFERAAMHPKAYLSQFHTKYNTTNLDQLVEENSQNTWADLFLFKREIFNNPELPTLWPWVLQNGFGTGATTVTAERNPYYFKVDPEGNQLPYMDRYVQELATDNEVLVLKGLNGELDWQEQWINAPKNKSVFFDTQEQGGFHLFELTPTTVNSLNILLNMNCTDPVIREINRNKDFRIGLSHAINRQELIDVVWFGNGTPAQTSPRPESKFYHERLSTQYLDFDLAKANEALDKAYPEKDAEGFRLGPDGKRISLIFEIDVGRTTYIDSLELIKKTWAEAGVEMTVKTMDRALWEQRVRSTDFEYHATCHIFGGGAGDAVLLDPRYWFPQNNTNSAWAKAWALWYNNPDSDLAEEPPAEVQEQMTLYRELRATSDEAKQAELMKQILDIQADLFPVIGVAFDGNFYGISANKLKNTPPVLPSSYDYPTPAPSNPNTWYIDEA
jgi:peptide/nickel transport system substrate-binding protein